MLLKKTVALVKTPVHLAKQYLQRRIDASYESHFVGGAEKSRARGLAMDMVRDGLIILPSYFRGSQLEKFCAAFGRVTAGKINPHTPDSFYTNDIFTSEPVLLQAALDNFLLEIIAGYFHRQFGLSVAVAVRTLPTSAHRDGSYQWHHDARGKQVNLMVLLSNVTAKGQRMSYLRGSHHRYYDYYRGIVDTRFNKDVDLNPEAQRRIVEVVGPPGTVALFDSNGLHSGHRNNVESRDALIINYASRRHFKKVRVHGSDTLSFSRDQRKVLTFNPNFELLE